MVLPDGIWTPQRDAGMAKDSVKAEKLVPLETIDDSQKSNRGCTNNSLHL
jgi:hypothetical protein